MGLLRPVVLVAVLISLNGCYLLQAAGGQWEVARRSESIVDVLADPATPAATRAGLERVVAARAFAESELALPASKSYRRYADLGRPYVVWNVVATPEFSIEPRRWCFPVAGCVAYRGYFDEADARALGLKLAMRGDDVAVGGVGTYSTLGHLPDPVFGSMLGWRETRLVGTIFHELAHEQLYVPGDSEFNEAFASVVEEEGLRRWLVRHGRPSEALQAFETGASRDQEFSSLLLETRTRLAQLYRSNLSLEAMRIEKQRELGRVKFAYEQLRARWGGYRGYDGWFKGALNNAQLASVATYRDCMPGLRRELDQAGSLPVFYARAQELARLTLKERHSAVCTTAADATPATP